MPKLPQSISKVQQIVSQPNNSRALPNPQRRVFFNLPPTTETTFLPHNQTPLTSSSTDNAPIPCFDLTSGAKYPNFISSHVLNPSPSVPPSSLTSSFDPLLPPTVKLTQQTIESTESRYALSRLRDKKTYENIRIFLAYLHDKSDIVCYEGKTKTSVIVSIQQEGLPTDVPSLKKLFIKYHELFNLSPDKVANDLEVFGQFVHSRRISHLQRSRADHDKFFR